MQVFVSDGYSEAAMQMDPRMLVGEVKQRMQAAPWEHELVLNDTALPIELSLVEAGVVEESTLVVQRHEVSETLQPLLRSLPPSTKKVLCDVCSNKRAIVYCPLCDSGVFLCSDCDGTEHQTKLGSKHVREKIKDSPVAVEKCNVHKLFASSYYCATCLTIVCSECALTSHKACNVISKEEAADAVRKQITALKEGFCRGKEVHQEELAALRKAEAELRLLLHLNLEKQAAVRASLREKWDAEALATRVLQQEAAILATGQLFAELEALAQKLQTELTLASPLHDAKHLYAVGGRDGSNDLASVERYDPANNTWSACAAMSTNRSSFGVAVLGGHL